MHVLGIHHQQTRSDRDNHVRINWRNILPGKEINFEKNVSFHCDPGYCKVPYIVSPSCISPLEYKAAQSFTEIPIVKDAPKNPSKFA